MLPAGFPPLGCTRPIAAAIFRGNSRNSSAERARFLTNFIAFLAVLTFSANDRGDSAGHARRRRTGWRSGAAVNVRSSIASDDPARKTPCALGADFFESKSPVQLPRAHAAPGIPEQSGRKRLAASRMASESASRVVSCESSLRRGEGSAESARSRNGRRFGLQCVSDLGRTRVHERERRGAGRANP